MSGLQAQGTTTVATPGGTATYRQADAVPPVTRSPSLNPGRPLMLPETITHLATFAAWDRRTTPMSFAPDLQCDEIADLIAELIARLGDTPDAIAYHLSEAGITGFRADATCCPIANYLLCAEPLLDSVAVLGDSIDYCATTGECGSLTVPDEINDFICQFDIERYPHLLTRWEATR